MDKNKIAFLKSFLTWFAIFYLAYWGAQNFLIKDETVSADLPQITVIPVDATPVLEHILHRCSPFSGCKIVYYIAGRLNWMHPNTPCILIA